MCWVVRADAVCADFEQGELAREPSEIHSAHGAMSSPVRHVHGPEAWSEPTSPTRSLESGAVVRQSRDTRSTEPALHSPSSARRLVAFPAPSRDRFAKVAATEGRRKGGIRGDRAVLSLFSPELPDAVVSDSTSPHSMGHSTSPHSMGKGEASPASSSSSSGLRSRVRQPEALERGPLRSPLLSTSRQPGAQRPRALANATVESPLGQRGRALDSPRAGARRAATVRVRFLDDSPSTRGEEEGSKQKDGINSPSEPHQYPESNMMGHGEVVAAGDGRPIHSHSSATERMVTFERARVIQNEV